jgi:hypothetical protein
MLDKYIETVIQGHGKDDKDAKKPNVQGEFFLHQYHFFLAYFPYYEKIK